MSDADIVLEPDMREPFIDPDDTSMLVRDQIDRVNRMRTQRLFLIDATASSSTEFTFVVTGSAGNLYEVHVNTAKDSRNVITCTCPDGIMMSKFKRIRCKHCCLIILRLFRLPPATLREGAITRAVCDVMQLEAERACEKRQWDNLTNREYQRKYKLMQGDESAATDASSYDIVEGADIGDCAICLDSQENVGESAQCLVCHQAMHRECLSIWLRCKRAKQCPLCRGSWASFYKAEQARKRSRFSVSSSSPDGMPKTTRVISEQYMNVHHVDGE